MDFERYICRRWKGSFHSVSGRLAALTNAEPTRNDVLERVVSRRCLVTRNSLVLASTSLVLASTSLALALIYLVLALTSSVLALSCFLICSNAIQSNLTRNSIFLNFSLPVFTLR